MLNANKFPEEIEEYKLCSSYIRKLKEKICPALCDFTDCEIKCESKLLIKYWNDSKKRYNDLKNEEIDYNTFNEELGKFEINDIKNKIKDLYRFEHVYLYTEILEYIMNSINQNNIEMFNKKFLDQALEILMPKTENDFNNFRDNVYDKYNKQGYLFRGEFYIFQPFDEKEMYFIIIEKKRFKQNNLVSMDNYIKNNFKDFKKTNEKNNKKRR